MISLCRDLCNDTFFCLARSNYSKEKKVSWLYMCDLANSSTNKAKGDLKQGDHSTEVYFQRNQQLYGSLYPMYTCYNIFPIIHFFCSHSFMRLFIIPLVPPFITPITTDLPPLLKMASTKERKTSFVLQKYLIKINVRIR